MTIAVDLGRKATKPTNQQSQFQRFFKPNFVYLLTNERYITYQTGFSFGRLGRARGRTWGYHGGLGGQKKSEIQPDFVCELLT